MGLSAAATTKPKSAVSKTPLVDGLVARLHRRNRAKQRLVWMRATAILAANAENTVTAADFIRFWREIHAIYREIIRDSGLMDDVRW